MRTRRLFLSLLLLLAFALGGVQYAPQADGGAQSDQAADMDSIPVVANGTSVIDASSSGMCSECNDADEARLACPPPCIGVPAILPDGSAASTDIAVADPTLTISERFNGRATPPDPYPPKLAFLG